MANLYTKTGDKGQTSLVGGARVSKSSPRVNCYGTIDEANSMLGLAYTQTEQSFVKDSIKSIQKKLFVVGAELASDEAGMKRLKSTVSEDDVSFLESIVDECTKTTGKQTHFVIPGVNAQSAALHVARTIVRRAEREIVAMAETEQVREVLVRYINRLSDAIYAMARLEETLAEQKQLVEKVVEIVKQSIGGEKTGHTPPFTLETLQRMAQYAERKAAEINVPVVFSAVDSGGNLILLHRMEGALLASVDISIGKAYSASTLKMPTHELAKLAQPGQPLYGIQHTNNGKIVVFGGGYPYMVDGKVVGAIGVSGGSVEQDMSVAEFALNQVVGGQV